MFQLVETELDFSKDNLKDALHKIPKPSGYDKTEFRQNERALTFTLFKD